MIIISNNFSNQISTNFHKNSCIVLKFNNTLEYIHLRSHKTQPLLNIALLKLHKFQHRLFIALVAGLVWFKTE